MQRVLYKIDKEWDTGVVNIQEYVDLVDLVHKDYYDLLYKFLSSEYNRGKRIAENRVNRKITSMVTKSDTPVYLKPDYKTGLTGTIQSTEQSLEDLTFTASEKTLNRVKQDKISKVLTEGYRKGLNGTEVGRHIKVEFGKLKTSEAVRIARTELHSAHEKGLIDQYRSMDVQYVQWDAHIDNRTRDTHIDLDGEITSINGHFSNGLNHPGDKNGAISEWIHCRCTLQPYLMPLGKKPPAGATYFREDDLYDDKLDNEILNEMNITRYEGFTTDTSILNNTYYRTINGKHPIRVAEITGEPDVFHEVLVLVKQLNSPKDKWRVDVHDAKDYTDCRLFVTNHGSTMAVNPEGDIISVCSNPLKESRDAGKLLMKVAVENGGKKLDSFSKNLEFYQKCGFEPVSYCKFNDDIDIRPHDWRPDKDAPEDVLFFIFTGKKEVVYKRPKDLDGKIPKFDDYDDAWEFREKKLKEYEEKGYL